MIRSPLRALSQIAISVPTQVAKYKGAATEDGLGNRRVPAERPGPDEVHAKEHNQDRSDDESKPNKGFFQAEPCPDRPRANSLCGGRQVYRSAPFRCDRGPVFSWRCALSRRTALANNRSRLPIEPAHLPNLRGSLSPRSFNARHGVRPSSSQGNVKSYLLFTNASKGHANDLFVARRYSGFLNKSRKRSSYSLNTPRRSNSRFSS